ncbi:MAG TPA: hypothetical protein VFA85_17460 [Terriglobales bacterium]|nr:hypothetical protein [Terriglobales bacterium]
MQQTARCKFAIGVKKMSKLALKLGCLVLLVSASALAQNNQMSISTAEHGPGDRLTLFITFNDHMPDVQAINCSFQLSTPPKPQQKLLQAEMSCNGMQKDSDTDYRASVDVPQNVATGEYELKYINVAVMGITKTYAGADLPPVAKLKIRNPKDDPNFAPMKQIKVQ